MMRPFALVMDGGHRVGTGLTGGRLRRNWRPFVREIASRKQRSLARRAKYAPAAGGRGRPAGAASNTPMGGPALQPSIAHKASTIPKGGPPGGKPQPASAIWGRPLPGTASAVTGRGDEAASSTSCSAGTVACSTGGGLPDDGATLNWRRTAARRATDRRSAFLSWAIASR